MLRNINLINMVKKILFTKQKRQYYNATKIQSLIRMKCWLLSYMKLIEPRIKALYQRKNNRFIYEPTIFGDNSEEAIKEREIAFRVRQRDMKEGELAQIIIGNWFGWEDLGVGHSSGLDCRRTDNSIIMELKNKYNTCNSGSAKAVKDKLSIYKRNNPNTRCIWAIVNPNPKNRKQKLYERIIHNGVEIEVIQGTELFKLVFSIGNINYFNRIIDIVQHYKSKY